MNLAGTPERCAGCYDITLYTKYFEAQFIYGILHFTDKPMS
jgi:hypothetical protein